MLDETKMIELIKVIQTDPAAAAKMLAASGLTPEQVFAAGGPQLGEMVNPATAVAPGQMPGGITATDNGTMSAGFTPGPAVLPPQAQPPTQGFSPPEQATNVVPFQTAELPPVNLNPDPAPTQVAGAAYQGGQPMDVALNPWSSTVMPEAGAQQPNLASLMAGFGKSAPAGSVDQKPIFGANAPAPKAPTAIGNAASMQALMQLIQGQAAPQMAPSLGMLMSRRA